MLTISFGSVISVGCYAGCVGCTVFAVGYDVFLVGCDVVSVACDVYVGFAGVGCYWSVVF